jgi:putative DNA primase/helicase
VLWGDPVEGEARALLSAAEVDPSSEVAVEQRDAAAWLRELLADGPMPAREVKRQADGAGHAWRTVQRAMRRAGVEPSRGGFGGGSVWALAPHSRHSRQPLEVGANGANGEVGANGELGEVF